MINFIEAIWCISSGIVCNKEVQSCVWCIMTSILFNQMGHTDVLFMEVIVKHREQSGAGSVVLAKTIIHHLGPLAMVQEV